MIHITWLRDIFCKYLSVLQVELYKTSRDLKKIKRHPDSVNINNKLKDMEKPKLKLEKTSGSQSDDMEVESHSSKKDEHKRKAVIAGTSSW